MFFLCNVPMVVIDHWAFRAFLRALRPSFERMLPSEGRKHLRGTIGLRYDEAQGFAGEGLARARGLVTLGIDSLGLGFRMCIPKNIKT